MTHRFECRVYYEDTDLAGIVYYANYLKYIELARTEMVRGLGVDQVMLRRRLGLVFAVRKITADYLHTASFDDLLSVETEITALSGARVTLSQRVFRAETLVFSSRVLLVCLKESGKPAPIPADIRQKLKEILR